MPSEVQPDKRRRRNCYLTAALGLAKRGYPVHPCRRYSKQPVLNDWPARATTDPRTISAWWRRWPHSNVAVATGGLERLLVIDIDPDKGGKASLSEVEGEHSIPSTVAVATPRGGLHLWLRVPGHPLPGNSAGKLGPGLDTRCRGGYVLVPPSLVMARSYRWSPSCGDQIAEAPAWLLERLGQAGAGQATPLDVWLRRVSSPVEEGARNDTISRLAGLLFRRMPAEAEVAAELLAAFNVQRCKPPLEHGELRQILDSIADRERRGRSR